MFADPLALNSWRSDESFDGLADVVFWGGAEQEVAQRVGADVVERVGSPIFRWIDRPVEEMVERWRQLDALRNDSELRFVVDFRPHDHHRQLLAQAARSSTDSGTIEVGGSAGPVVGHWLRVSTRHTCQGLCRFRPDESRSWSYPCAGTDSFMIFGGLGATGRSSRRPSPATRR